MTPSEYTAAMLTARRPDLDPDERARQVAKHLGLDRDGRELLAAALHASGDRMRSIAVDDACSECPYGSI